MSNSRRRENFDQTDSDDGDSNSLAAVGSDDSLLSDVGIEERLSDILLEDGARVMQWLQALDMQVIGACRADERSKPLLKLNVSGGVAEDRLLAHLSQHFEPSEVGLLARCLCFPLVSIRVGKVIKQGSLLCPTTVRGNLNLILLPTSDLRMSFIGDDGQSDILLTLSSDSQLSVAVIEEISADKSGRSFLVKSPNSSTFYFWFSEKSKVLGIELLGKMKDLLLRKPSVADITGISESRLDCFATHLRAYLIESAMRKTQTTSCGTQSPSDLSEQEPAELGLNVDLSSSKSPHSRHSQSVKATLFSHSILSPRSNSFKEGMGRNFSTIKNVVRERLRRGADGHQAFEDLPIIPPSSTTKSSSSNYGEKNNLLPETTELHLQSGIPSSLLETLEKSVLPPSLTPLLESSAGSIFTPYYRWCPPVISTLQYTVTSTELPFLTTDSLSLPPLSSLLPATRSSSLLSSVPSIPSMDLPAFLPDPLVRMPFSVPSSQQIATFTPLMCDPIVHIPVIDVCSAGQGYLVSAGPGVATNVPPLHPKLVSPLIPEADVLEKGARETLRMLIGGSEQTSKPSINVLPRVFREVQGEQSILVSGSRGLYCGAHDVGAIAALGVMSLTSEVSVGDGTSGRCRHKEKSEKSRGSDETGTQRDDYED